MNSSNNNSSSKQSSTNDNDEEMPPSGGRAFTNNNNNNSDENVHANLKLIEASLRCLANLYASAQMAPSLVVALDSQLYVFDVGTKQAVNMDSLLKLFQLGRPSKSRASSGHTNNSSIK